MNNFNDIISNEKYIELRKSSQNFNNICESLMDSNPDTEIFLSIIAQLCILSEKK